MPSDQTTRIPHVPIRTPMYDGDGRMARAWIIFFERLGQLGGSAPAAGDLYWRTLLLKDATVGDDIADHVTAQAAGTAQFFVGVLRVAITEDLTVQVNLDGAAMCTLTIPAATAVDTPVETTSFDLSAIAKGQVFSWDVTASDGQSDGAGVASFTLAWS